jgi:hypothetical protein
MRMRMRRTSRIDNIVETNSSLEIDESLENSHIEDSRIENRMHRVSHTEQMQHENRMKQNRVSHFDSRNVLYAIKKNADSSITRQRKERIRNATLTNNISSIESVLSTNNIYNNESSNMKNMISMRMK